jgi:hypothetical protein
VQKLQILFENENHHNGSLYCVDWSRSQRLIASGSNDREIKILVTPNLENEEVLNQLLVLVLKGHTALAATDALAAAVAAAARKRIMKTKCATREFLDGSPSLALSPFAVVAVDLRPPGRA